MKKTLWMMVFPAVILVFAAWAQTSAVPEAERAAILQTARDYGDGFYAGDADRMARAVHPDLNKVVVTTLPQTKAVVIGYSTYSDLIELSRAKVALTNPVRTIQPEALWMKDDVACAKLTSPMYNDYLQMVKIDGAWKIVNVLWAQGPQVPGVQPLAGFDPEKEKAAVAKAAEDYMIGSLSGDAARVEAVLHPEVSRAVLQTLPQTGRPRISRNGYSALVEPIRAKLRVTPEDQRKADVRVLDVMDGMAFVLASTAFGDYYLQMSWMNGTWKILNILVKPAPQPAPALKK